MSESSNTSPAAEPAPDPSEHPQSPADGSRTTLDPLKPHNKRLSTVSGTPAQVSIESSDVQGSLVQPTASSSNTPVQPPSNQTGSSYGTNHASPIASPGDYFSSASAKDPGIDSKHDGGSDLASQTVASRQTMRLSDSASQPNSEPANPATSPSLEHLLAAQRDSIAAASTQRPTARDEGRDTDRHRLRPRRSLTEYPAYPNQSLAALSSQIYPENHQAPYSSRPKPGRYHPTHTLGVFSRMSSPSNSGDERQARTVGNTPIQTPGSLSPHALRQLPSRSGPDGESPVPSPYLHPVQPQAPKETNKAVRDLDSYSGRKTINQYEILYELGKGTHGKVKLGRDVVTGENVAIKIVQRFAKRRRLGKAQDQEDKVKKEIAILKKALHPNVVSMLEVIDDPDLHKIYLVLEFCEAHDVRWRHLGESEIILMQHQRPRSLQGNITNFQAAANSDDAPNITETARQPRRRRRPRPQPHDMSDSPLWSLEYTGDSEPDGEDQLNLTSASRRGSHYSDHRRQALGTDLSLDTHASLLTADGDDNSTSGPDHRMSRGACNTTMGSPDTQLLQAEDHSDAYGADGHVRQPSLADSSSLMVTDLMERTVTEERRYVPLLTITESRRAFRDALLGLEYLHYQGIIHRDIKPENLLRKADHSVKISDFGVSYLGKPIREGRESEETSDAEGSEFLEDEADLAKTVGTPAFYAPELCDLGFTEDKPRVTGQIDVWALGVTLYCFLYARLPFRGNNEFEMMRRIVTDDIDFPRKRLQAVDLKGQDRLGSHGPQFRLSNNHRLPHEIIYEEIDDELYDLLKRLLEKDPGKRISVKEIKHHPWVLRDLPNHVKWLDDTDPNRFLQGRKIEISNEEIHEAVAPLRLVERAKSVVKKAMGGLGFGAGSRKRGQSSTASSEASSSPGPFSPHVHSFPSHEHSRSDDSLSANLKSSREQLHHQSHAEHPLSQSVTASPELEPRDAREVFRDADELVRYSTRYTCRDPDCRPSPPDRQESVMSTAASVRTVKQSDFASVEHAFAADLPGMRPAPQEQYGAHLFNMLGEAGRNLLKTVRSRDRNAPDDRPASSAPSHSSVESFEHLQGQPSVALSSTSAVGHLSQSAQSLPIGDANVHVAQDVQRSGANQLSQNPSFLQLSPPSPHAIHAKQPAASSNSSEDHLNSAISRETSFPSIPSVISADSSMGPDPGGEELTTSGRSIVESNHKPGPSSNLEVREPQSQSAQPKPLILTSDQDHNDQQASEQHPVTDEDDSDSEDGEYLVMNRSRSRSARLAKAPGRSGSANTVRNRASRLQRANSQSPPLPFNQRQRSSGV
ncbi:MAG: hypothetical protein Q9162_001879 [Coniocarpon cinnabarinum]